MKLIFPLNRLAYFLFLLSTFVSFSQDKKITIDLSKQIVTPKTYVVYKTEKSIIIDGIDTEDSWKNTDFTTDFTDIFKGKTPKHSTKIKMLWDKNYLYVYAKLEEKHIWGNITERDKVIYYNNDFEVFINPSNNIHNYCEIEINALGTVWDLALNKPYLFEGKAKTQWDLNDLKSKVFIKGTLNNPKDIDEFWSIEMAIPLKGIRELKNNPRSKTKDGEQWRINFSRVEWDFELKDGIYSRKKENNKYLPEYNWVWSNQGAINMHIPENWGYIQFSDNNPKDKINFKHQTDAISEQIIYALFRNIKSKELKYLKKEKAGTLIYFNPITVQGKTIHATFLKTFTGYSLKAEGGNITYKISENGMLRRENNQSIKK